MASTAALVSCAALPDLSAPIMTTYAHSVDFAFAGPSTPIFTINNVPLEMFGREIPKMVFDVDV